MFSTMVLVFSLLSASYWKAGQGDIVLANRLTVGGGHNSWIVLDFLSVYHLGISAGSGIVEANCHQET
ncbi:unnamed protein product [Penicillium crustosum]